MVYTALEFPNEFPFASWLYGAVCDAKAIKHLL